MYMTAKEIRFEEMKNHGTYSKKEHSESKLFSALEAMMWNVDLPGAEQYTKEEHSSAPRINVWEAMLWNEFLPDHEQYTEEEIDKLSINQQER